MHILLGLILAVLMVAVVELLHRRRQRSRR
jgi:hypothetical protein